MRLFNKYMLLALAIMAAAQGCDKEPIGTKDTGAPIMLSASEAGTKALLSETSFATTDNLIKIYDIYTPAGSDTPNGTPYIDDHIKSKGPDNDIWPFVGNKYNWTPDGTHKFFGWLAEDKNMTEKNTPESFFVNGTGFGYDSQVITIPSTTINADSPQFDFMYSNVHVRDLNTNPDYVSSVPLEFRHLFTAFSIAAQNMTSNFEITVESITIEGLMNTRAATISYVNAGDTDYPTITYLSKSNDNPNNADYSFSPSYQLGTDLIDMSTKSTSRNYFMSWPMTEEESKNVSMTIKYRVDNDPNAKTKLISLSGKEWEAGKKNNVNLVFKDKEIILQCVVMDWIPQEEEIDFSDQVSVRDLLVWDATTVKSINYETGEVILYDDVNIKALCSFHIDTPKGATWTASLIPIEGHQDAFKLVESTKYGAVGVDSQIKLAVTNQAPIAPKHICILRITVQTADGRTIVVRNLVPDGKSYTEFKIIQNLING